ncbi:hypothetical protein ACFSR6_03755 [Pedobacter vanadiisoli]|uniref:YD repeat-containing protein n=1 Tax=Pedobacter vanadiisoli TaxID=1761975 RepID=A0ABW5MFM9_9SPHI
MLKKLIAFTSCVILAANVYAQRDLKSLTPNAASLSKYAEIPVSYYSGIPQISVPIYTLKNNVLDIPISISYHASGIKLSEAPSWAGLGWSLNAGGVITRVVKGYPDDYTNSNFGFANAGIKSKIRAAAVGDYYSIFDTYERSYMEASAPSVFTLNDAISEPIDTESDLYFFNFLGNTGKFTFNNEGQIQMLQESDLKIEYIDRKFKITDGQGIIYSFNDTEESYCQFANMPTVLASYYSSWNLSSVYNPSTISRIDFLYQKDPNGIAPNNIDSEPFYYFDHIKFFDDSYFKGYDPAYGLMIKNGEPADWQEYFLSQHFQHQRNDPRASIKSFKVLRQIITGADTINVFPKYTPQQDINLVHVYCMLDSITIKTSGKKISKTEFKFGRFEGVDVNIGNYKLEELNVDDKKYSFKYYETFNGKSPFKSLGLGITKGMDLYGYYNGEDGKPYPDSKIFDINRISEIGVKDRSPFWGVNSSYRNADWKYAQIGTLKEIQEPTGGKTTFEYDGNQFSYLGYMGAQKIDEDYRIQYKFDSLNTVLVSAAAQMDPYEQPALKSEEFILHNNQTISITTNIGMTPVALGPNISLDEYLSYINANTNTFAIAQIKKYNSTTDQFETIYEKTYDPAGYIGIPNDDNELNSKRMLFRFTESISMALPEGRYKIENSCHGPAYQSNIRVETKFNYKTGNIYNGNGLRIRKINYIAEGSPVISKNFSYEIGNNSSGVLETPIIGLVPKINYFTTPKPKVIFGFDGYFVERSLFFDVYKNLPVSSLNYCGVVLGYAKVTETMNDGRKTVYYYSTGSNIPLHDYVVAPDEYEIKDFAGISMYTHLKADNSSFRGLLRQIDHYDSSNQIKKRIFSDYLNGEMPGLGNSISLVLSPKSFPQKTPQNDLLSNGQFSFVNLEPSYVFIYGVNNSKLRDSVVTYFPSGQVIEVTKYEYDFNKQFSPTKISYVNSKGQSHATIFKYAKDFSNIPVYQQMADNLHMISPVIEKRESLNGNLSQSFKTNYSYFNNSSIILPSLTQSSYANEPYEDNIKFLKYDDNGNLLSFKDKNSADVCYVYSYGNKALIAEIKNITYDVIESILGGTVAVRNFANAYPSDNVVRDYVANLRTSPLLKDAQITTYTYKPMVGITSMTDAKGMITYYEYDSFQRLKTIKDQNGNILKQTDYHYKN